MVELEYGNDVVATTVGLHLCLGIETLGHGHEDRLACPEFPVSGHREGVPCDFGAPVAPVIPEALGCL